MNNKTSKVVIILLCTFGLLFLIIGIVLPMVFPSIFESMLNKKLVLRPGGQTMKTFTNPPVPIYMQFYMFNLTNADDVLNGSKPILEQIGPYTYFETRSKFGFEWDDDAGTLKYHSRKGYYFDPDKSNGLKESDIITTINPVLITLGTKVEESGLGRSVLGLWSIRFNIEPFISKTVGDLLFHGYEEDLLRQLGTITKKPSHIAGRFGFFYPRNNTDGGTYTIYTGAKGMENYQFIAKWEGREKINFWSRDDCNMINGTEGSQFPRPAVKSQSIRMFTAELCRSIYAVFEKEVQHGDVTLYRYILPPELLADTDENQCYCTTNFTCRASMINVSPCKDDAPVIISTPHFYQGSQDDVDLLVGLNPMKEEHETYLDVEPRTGVVFRAAKRLQINMPLRPLADFPKLMNVPEVIFPILWVDENVEVPLERTNAVDRKLTLPGKIVKYGGWSVAVLGAILLIIGLVLIIKFCKSNNKDQSNLKVEIDGSGNVVPMKEKHYKGENGPHVHKLLDKTKSEF